MPSSHISLALIAAALVASCSTDLPGPARAPGGAPLPGGLDVTELASPDLAASDTGATDSDALDALDALDTLDAALDTHDVGGDDTRDATDVADLADTTDAGPTCATDADCDDGLPCTGVETCSPQTSTCQPGVPVAVDQRLCRDTTTEITCDGAGQIASSSSCPLDCNLATGACREHRLVTVGADTTANHVVAVDDVSFDDDDAPGTNSDTGAGGTGHRVTTDSFLWLRFDLSALPDGVEVMSVTLELYSAHTANTGEGSRPTHLALGADTAPARDWVQSEATWTHYDSDPSHTWTSGGGAGDRGATIAMVDVPPEPIDARIAWPFDDTGIAAVAQQLASDRPLVLTLWGAGGGHDREYSAAEGPDGQRPHLLVDYIW